jgi:hypothetical protein
MVVERIVARIQKGSNGPDEPGAPPVLYTNYNKGRDEQSRRPANLKTSFKSVCAYYHRNGVTYRPARHAAC